jgi:hypothetical protein
MAKRLIPSDPDPADVIARIRPLVRQLRVLHERLSHMEELTYTIFSDLEKIVEEVGEYHIPTPGTGAPTRPAPARASLRRMGESGAVTIEIIRHADLSAAVRVDSHEPFPLSPMLADLLEALCHEGGRITDEKAGWKTREEVLLHLSKRAGREITKHALTNAIYRLRRELESGGGVNPFLLQTTRTGWLRFAVLRPDSHGRSEENHN